MYSIIDSRIPIDKDFCVVSVVHDKNAPDTDYYNGFIILEKMENDEHTIKKIELTIDEQGKGTTNSKTYVSAEEFKQEMQRKDCYAFSFGIDNPESVEANLKQPLLLDSNESYARLKKQFLFFSSDINVFTVTSSEWARRQVLKLNRDIDYPENIELFIKQSTHIGNLSPSPRCLVM